MNDNIPPLHHRSLTEIALDVARDGHLGTIPRTGGKAALLAQMANRDVPRVPATTAKLALVIDVAVRPDETGQAPNPKITL